MTKPSIPDPETRARNVSRLRDACRQLDTATLLLDELIAMVETELRYQRKARLLGKQKGLEKIGD